MHQPLCTALRNVLTIKAFLCKERGFSNNNAAAAAPGWAGIEKPQPITSRRHAIYKRAPPSLEAFRVNEYLRVRILRGCCVRL